MRRARNALLWAQAGSTVALIAYAVFGRGRPEANGHPDIRGGGDWGFGGTDEGRWAQ